MSVHDITLHINGQPRRVAALPAGTLLVDLLRDHLRLTGSHVGGDTAQCGACTVLLDGRAVKSCNLLALQAEGAAIETVEGLAAADTWHPLQLAFSQHHALQCGFCTPGLLRDGSDSRLLAGGQTLLAAKKLGLLAPTRLIDLSRLPALQALQAGADGVWQVGAMLSHATLARHPGLRQHCPGLAALAALAALAGGIADAQVRERGTIGGSAANADPSACWPAGLLALGALLHTDRRSIAADDFFTGLFGTALAPDELLCSLQLPRPQRMAYVKFEQPASRFALVGVAVAQFAGGVRVALTGSARGWLRLPAFEAALSRRFEPAALAGLRVEASLMSSDLHAGADYRAHLAAVAVRRAVLVALGGPAAWAGVLLSSVPRQAGMPVSFDPGEPHAAIRPPLELPALDR